MRLIFALLLIIPLMGCESLKLRNIGKSGVTTGVAYAVGGVVPAVGVLATAMAYDEIIPAESSVNDIESTEQAVAYVLEKGIVWSAVGFIAFLLISLVIAPRWSSKRADKKGYARAKDKYKAEVKLPADLINKIREKVNDQ